MSRRIASSAHTEQRELAAIMFTDMVGYSALAQRDDQLALELLEKHRRLLRELFARFNGIEISPYWKDLRPNPRVQAILRKMNLVK